MVTAAELGNQAMSITALSFRAGTGSDPQGPYDNLGILMGHTGLSALTDTFDDNWSTSGTTVLSAPNYYITGVTADSWVEFQLDTPFAYDGSSNLLIEVVWDGPAAPLGEGSIYTWQWVVPENRVLTAISASAATGLLQTVSHNMLLEYEPMALEAMTFGAVKASF